MKLNSIRLLLCGLALMAGCQSAFADMQFSVSLDTSSAPGTGGYLDFQFNPGGAQGDATATITGFAIPGGGLIGPPSLTGAVSGDLTSTVVFDNSTALNELFQEVTFGSSVTFNILLSGPAVGGNYTGGALFSLFAYDSLGAPILPGTNAFADASVAISINPDGTVTDESGAGYATVSAAAVPEPSSFLLLGASLVFVGLRFRR